jgi:hypothetical protein
MPAPGTAINDSGRYDPHDQLLVFDIGRGIDDVVMDLVERVDAQEAPAGDQAPCDIDIADECHHD